MWTSRCQRCESEIELGDFSPKDSASIRKRLTIETILYRIVVNGNWAFYRICYPA